MSKTHAPGHVRDAFCAATEAFLKWTPGEPEPSVALDDWRNPRSVTVSEACGLVWNCRDILPALLFDELRGGLPMRRQTYAACARAMKAAVTSGPA